MEEEGEEEKKNEEEEQRSELIGRVAQRKGGADCLVLE